MRGRLLRVSALLAVLLLAGGVLVMAAYTPTGRELLSLAYLEGTFLPDAVSRAEEAMEEREARILAEAETKLEAVNGIYAFQAGAVDGSLLQSESLDGSLRFKKGDLLTLGSGAGLVLLAGEAELTNVQGAVVDTTDGSELSAGQALSLRHRCLAAERTVAGVTICSDTAVLALEGGYYLTGSDSTDYNMLADAMKAMGLFRGGDTAYGSGYDLERAPTRIEGLIMFLRLLGEESAALATSAPCPFTDVPQWCQSYVAYAYEKGYTNGVGAGLFAPAQTISANEYLTFLLRVLGYRDSGESPDFSWDTALAKALGAGVLTAKEHKMLTEQSFLRAQVVYVSYYGLDAAVRNGGQSLSAVLTASGALDRETVAAARSAVTTQRIR